MTNAEILDTKTIGNNEMILLWKNNSGLIHRAIYKWTGRGIPFEDLKQEAYFALVVAVRRYNKQTKWKFSTILGHSLDWYFIRFFNGNSYLKNEILSLNAPLAIDDSNGIELLDTLPDDTNIEEDVIDDTLTTELREICREAITRLDLRHRKIIHQHYLEGMAFARIGEIENISRAAVYKLCKTALGRLRTDYKLRSAVRKCRMEDAYHTAGLKATSLSSFRNNGASSQEQFLLLQEYFKENRSRSF